MIEFPIVAANESLLVYLRAGPTVYHLFTSPAAITPATVIPDFVEPNWPGYAPQTVPRWYPDLPLALPAIARADPLVWYVTTQIQPVTVLGYFVTAGIDGQLLWCEMGPTGGWTLASPGQCVTLYPKIQWAAAESVTLYNPPLKRPLLRWQE